MRKAERKPVYPLPTNEVSKKDEYQASDDKQHDREVKDKNEIGKRFKHGRKPIL